MAEQPIEDRGRVESDDSDGGHDATGVKAAAIRTAFAAARTTDPRPPKLDDKPEVIPGDADK